MIILFLVGRVLFGGYFVMNGLNHFMKMGMMKGYASSKSVPMASMAVAITGLMILLGGLGILMGVYIQLSVLLLAIFLVFVTFKMHNFWAVTEPNMKMMEMVNFYKNMALLGAVLMMLFIPSPWVYGI